MLPRAEAGDEEELDAGLPSPGWSISAQGSQACPRPGLHHPVELFPPFTWLDGEAGIGHFVVGDLLGLGIEL